MSNQHRSPYYDDGYPSEEAFARCEGFHIDDDGHWIPLDEMESDPDPAEYDDIGMDNDFDIEYINEIEYAHSEGFYVDDDGHWIPEEDMNL